ncbi:MAG: NADH-quinone oxidoreductase subunit NuoE [Chloroflexota bacterium]|nr:NADH-quinone oxidoreductase subunit NuoE [Chloroflexota bacterium]
MASTRTTDPNMLLMILARWAPVGRSGLLPALIETQEVYGWLSEDTLAQIAQGLGVPISEAYGVADFYAHLYTRPVGKKFVRVCDDVPCYLAGSDKICAAVEKHLRIREGETTPDGAFTYEIVACLGHCDHAPVVMIDKQVRESVTVENIENLLTGKTK